MRIAVIDYRITPTNPIGGCHLRMIAGLCHEHQFTIFALEFKNPDPQRIEWVRIYVPKRPQALLFVMFHIFAPIYYWLYRFRRKVCFDAVQMVESNFSFGDVSYSQFCHRGFLKNQWPRIGAKGLLGACRWLDHYFRALLEPLVYQRVKKIVVPSHGLARELKAQYPSITDKIHLLPNPVDVQRMRCPSDFDRREFRARLGFADDHVVLVFSALGHFERKGLPALLSAVAELGNTTLKILIVGGQAQLIKRYQSIVAQIGLRDQVVFAGMQQDVRPFLWAADAFVLPSFYEAFPLVSLEAAAAGLPSIVSPIHGVEELIKDGHNGILVHPTALSIARALKRFLKLQPDQRRRMGQQAAEDVQIYATPMFLDRWRKFFGQLDVFDLSASHSTTTLEKI